MRFEPANRSLRILPVVAVLLASLPQSLGAQDPRLSEEWKASRPEVPPQAPPAPVRKPAFELAGLAKLEGDASFALLQEPELTNGAPVFVRQGQSIGPYRLVAVEEDRVLLESATGVITVHLAGSKDTGPVAVVPPPKPAPQVPQAPSVSAEPTTNPVAAVSDGPVSPEPTMTAEESVAAALKGTRGEKVLDMLKNALGLGANP